MILVTGASSGIGAATARALNARGHDVIPAGRNERRTRAVAERIGAPVWFTADFASLDEVSELAAGVLAHTGPRGLDVLVNNAGALYPARERSAEGVELTMAANHLSPFLLTNLLLDALRACGGGRVVTTASAASAAGAIVLDDLNWGEEWSPWTAYANAKLANVLFTRELARREAWAQSGVVATCLHPGIVRTRLGRGRWNPLSVGWKLYRPLSREEALSAAAGRYATA